MNNVDYDKKKFCTDGHGNLIRKRTKKVLKYKGHTIDKGIGHVKIWDASDKFVEKCPDVQTAKDYIDSLQVYMK